MVVFLFCKCTGIRTGDGKGQSPLHAEESPRKPEGFRESEASEIPSARTEKKATEK